MFSKTVIHERMPGHPEREEALIAEAAKSRGVPVERGSVRMMERGNIDIDDTTLVAGPVPFVKAALNRLGIALPLPNPYPESLRHLLHRDVSIVRDVRTAMEIARTRGKVFIKPAERWKSFTGFVTDGTDTLMLNGSSLNQKAWVSEPVEFVSEWRVHVLHGKVLGVSFCDFGGDRRRTPDDAIIREAVDTLSASADAAHGYVIDFGVLANGDTALVELNDGFSFGAYEGIDADIYWNIVAARWKQLLSA